MKKLIFLFLFITTVLFSQQSIKIGEKATIDGIVVDTDKLKDYVAGWEENKINRELIKDQKIEIQYLKDLIKLKDEQIGFEQTKYNLAEQVRKQLENDLKIEKIKVNVLGWMTGIGWGLVVGETAGISIYVVMKRYGN